MTKRTDCFTGITESLGSIRVNNRRTREDREGMASGHTSFEVAHFEFGMTMAEGQCSP